MNLLRFFIILCLTIVLNSSVFATPQQYNISIKKAYTALKNGNYQAAIQNYNNALKYDPKNAEIYNNLGVAYSRINDLNNAELNYKKAIRIDPSNTLAYSNLSSVYERKEQYIEAARALENYAKLTPSDKNVYYRLCHLYYKAENKDSCIENGEKHVKYSTDKFNTYLLMAESCKKHEDFNRAVYYYKKALSCEEQQYNENLTYAIQELKECQFKRNLSRLNPTEKAPPALYGLITTGKYIKHSDTLPKLYEILDLLWNDTEGRFLLNKVIVNKIPIKITYGREETNAMTSTSYKQTPLSAVRYIPMPIYVALPTALFLDVFKSDLKREVKVNVNLGEDIIRMYKSTEKIPTLHDNMYSIMTVMHEFGHAAVALVDEKHQNSIEEELTVSMIGYNTASKILIGRSLTREGSIETAVNSYKSLMTDEHRKLPLYNNFSKTISKLGINLYNYDTYSNIYRIQQEAERT